MKKTWIAIALAAMLLTASCGGGEKVYIEGDTGDGFSAGTAPTATPVPTIAPDERDFRGMKWGMSLSDITHSEGNGYKTVDEGVIRYGDLIVGGFESESEYTLEEGKLVQCVYYTTHFHNKTEDYITDYTGLQTKYTEKYGTPKYNEKKWGDGQTTSEDLAECAKALNEGKMMYRTGWECGNTRINLVLFKDTDAKVKIGIRYQPIDKNVSSDVAPIGQEDI